MTIENFKNMYPADQLLLKESVARKKNAVESDVVTLTRQFVQEASYGLSEAFEGFSKESLAYVPNRDLFAKMPDALRQKATLHHAGIIFGLSIICFEEALLTRKLNMDVFEIDYNMAISNSPLKKNTSRAGQIIDLTPQEMGAMYATMGKDRTFGGFFETKEGVESIPSVLREIVTGENLYMIRKDILPMFTERARLLAK